MKPEQHDLISGANAHKEALKNLRVTKNRRALYGWFCVVLVIGIIVVAIDLMENPAISLAIFLLCVFSQVYTLFHLEDSLHTEIAELEERLSHVLELYGAKKNQDGTYSFSTGKSQETIH